MEEEQNNTPETNQEVPNPEGQTINSGNQQPSPVEPQKQEQQSPAQLIEIPKKPKTPPSKKILIISFAFLFVSILIIVGYYIYTLLSKEEAQLPPPATTNALITPTLKFTVSPIPEITIQAQNDEAADWKTFTSSKGYQIKHPTNLKPEEQIPGFRAFLNENTSPMETVFTIDEREETTLANKRSQEEKNIANPSFTDFTVSGLNGFTSEGALGSGYGEGLYVKSAFIDMSGTIVNISCGTYELCQTTLLDQILSTFELLE